MRILILNHNQEKFGTYWRCYYFGEGLSNRGHQVTMVCASGKTFDLTIHKKKINQNFTLITLPRVKYYTYYTGQIILRLPLYLYYCLFSKYDLLYAFTVAQPQIGIPAMLAKLIRRKKLIIDWDDLWGGGFAEQHFTPVKIVLNTSEKFFLKFADLVTCASQKLLHDSQKQGINERKLFLVPNGCDSSTDKRVDNLSAKNKLKISTSNKYILSMGNTYNSITLNLLLDTYEILNKKMPNIRFIFLSSLVLADTLKQKYKNIIKETLFTGFVSEEEKHLYLSAADVLVLPMENNPIEEARFPIRLGDYLCAGRPIASNAVGEVKCYLEKYNAGLTSPPDSPIRFADNIIKAITDKELADTISRNARKLAEGDLSRENVVSQLDKIINSLV